MVKKDVMLLDILIYVGDLTRNFVSFFFGFDNLKVCL